ncbi:MAG: amidohydrolase family protein [Alphaproteobacteria bacterium]|jgi:predicted TIM-barrel fold metal-dependent hydrolase|nr:amidohydrolase family protein [Alphaproteobacteria bacterium]MDP6516353.1 amidohydrolase family protein [Alphaproteobacteria bacterium]
MDRAEWLALTEEPVIDPGLAICDPHHHLWDFPDSRYLIDEVTADTGSGHDVVSTVFVECTAMYRQDGPAAMKPIGETEFVQGVAAQSASGHYGPGRIAAGIVSFADLTLGGAVAPVLEAHIAASPNRFRGIRHASAWDASPDIRNSHTKPHAGLLRESEFRAGFACLESFGLSFDAWLYFTQIDDVADLAKAFPDTPIILDHVGGPLGIGPYKDGRDAVFAQWTRAIDRLAQCPNVVVKLGGLSMSQCGFAWHHRDRPPGSEALAQATAPYFLHCIERFGVERCMFESNFPVDKVSCSYRVLWNSFKRVTADFSAAERAALFHDTAARVYRLK